MPVFIVIKPDFLMNSNNYDNRLFSVLFVMLAVPFVWHYLYYESGTSLLDLPSFYFAAKAAFIDNVSPYTHANLLAYMGENGGNHIYPFLYPPVGLVVFYPLNWISLQSARTIAVFGNLILVFYCLFLTGALVKKKTALFMAVTAIIFLLGQPTRVTILYGQVNFLVLAFMLTFWKFFSAGRTYLAQLFLVGAIILKTYPITLLGIVVFKGLWKETALAAGLLGASFLIGYFIVPSEYWMEWFQNVVPAAGYGKTPQDLFSPDSPYNQSLNGFIFRMTGSPTAEITCSVLAIAIISLCFMFTTVSKDFNQDKNNKLFALYLISSFLLAPYSWEHHMVLVFPAFCLLIYSFLENKSFAVLRYTALAVTVVCMQYPFYHPLLQTSKFHALFCYFKLYSIVILYMFLVADFYKEVKGEA